MIVEPWIKDLADEFYSLESDGRRLWSVWDMLRFHANTFVDCFRAFSMANATAINSRELNHPLPDSVSESIDKNLRELRGHLVSLGLGMSVMSCDRLLYVLSQKPKMNDTNLQQLFVDIYFRMRDELGNRMLFSLNPSTASYFEPDVPLFGAEVDTKFPSAIFDISEAGKCYALGRHTACMMHLMRAMEKPLELMASDLGVDTTRANWGQLIPKIEGAISSLPNSDADRRTLFSEAAVQFRFVKDAWRDHAMHARGKYIEDEAKNAMDACKVIAQRLASRLSE